MPKVRDLGINVIPVTMRPLEIGPGAVVVGDPHRRHYIACAGTSNCMNCVCNNTDIEPTSCDPSGCPSASTKDKDKGKKKTSAIGAEAAMLLQQQLRARISEPRSH
ncbi:MAG TPA: hypothetical protein VM733_12765 [Thermoanaerobaculia bacterium]|nr:hypothetical protein [Thermoanaerobaculia bacterium]